MTQSSHFSFLNENVNFIGNNALKEINVLLLPKIDSQKYLLSFVTCICLSFIHTHTHTPINPFKFLGYMNLNQIQFYSFYNDSCVCVCVCVCVRMHAHECTQPSPVLCDPMDCSLPGFSVLGIFPARILERVAISSSRKSS